MRSCFSSCIWPHSIWLQERRYQKHLSLSKKNGGEREIATGTSFRRLVAKSLAVQFEQKWRTCALQSSSRCQLVLAGTVLGTKCGWRPISTHGPLCCPLTAWERMTTSCAAQWWARCWRWTVFVVCCHSLVQLMHNPLAIIGKMTTVGFTRSDNTREESKEIHWCHCFSV